MRWRRFAAVLGALSLVVVGGGRAAAQSGYTSPFSITLAPDSGSWTSDFAARQAAIDANTSPPKADWYTAGTSYVGYPYGPLNPQLYSSASIGSPATAAALQFDRGAPVLSVTMNAVPGGVDPTTWQRQRILAAADVLLQAGTPYQHLHLPDFDPSQVTSGTFPWLPVSTGTALQSSWQLVHGQSGTTPNPYAAAYGRPTAGIDCTDSAGNTFPLVISSHDNTPAIFDTLALDATGFPSDGNIAGHLPPPGVHILPFAASNWFYQDFQVAMRVVAVPEPAGIVLAVVGGVAAAACRVRRGPRTAAARSGQPRRGRE